jgi:hypothetical protein
MPFCLSDKQWDVVREAGRPVPYAHRENYLLAIVNELQWRKQPLVDADVIAATAHAVAGVISVLKDRPCLS